MVQASTLSMQETREPASCRRREENGKLGRSFFSLLSTPLSPRHAPFSFLFCPDTHYAWTTMMHISSARTRIQELASWSSSLIIRRAAGHGAVKTSLARPPCHMHALFSIVPTTRGTIECLSTCHLHAGLDRSFDLQGFVVILDHL